MGWLKNVVVDIAVTIVIAIAVTSNERWVLMVAYGYSVLMLALKLIYFSGPAMQKKAKKQKDAAPAWFIYLLYAINAGLFGFYSHWIFAGIWIVIGVLSYMAQKHSER